MIAEPPTDPDWVPVGKPRGTKVRDKRIIAAVNKDAVFGHVKDVSTIDHRKLRSAGHVDDSHCPAKTIGYYVFNLIGPGVAAKEEYEEKNGWVVSHVYPTACAGA